MLVCKDSNETVAGGGREVAYHLRFSHEAAGLDGMALEEGQLLEMKKNKEQLALSADTPLCCLLLFLSCTDFC